MGKHHVCLKIFVLIATNRATKCPEVEKENPATSPLQILKHRLELNSEAIIHTASELMVKNIRDSLVSEGNDPNIITRKYY